MADFVSGFTQIITGVFGALIQMLSSLGELFFKLGAENGAITGLTPFGWLFTIILGVPIATWLFNKAITFIKGIRAK